MKSTKNDDCDFEFLFTDELYENTHHASANIHLHTENNVHHKTHIESGKGHRLIILHAITRDGSLVEE